MSAVRPFFTDSVTLSQYNVGLRWDLCWRPRPFIVLLSRQSFPPLIPWNIRSIDVNPDGAALSSRKTKQGELDASGEKSSDYNSYFLFEFPSEFLYLYLLHSFYYSQLIDYLCFYWLNCVYFSILITSWCRFCLRERPHGRTVSVGHWRSRMMS